jgi:hypothetical protein
VPDKVSVNCLDSGLCYSDAGTCACEKGADVPSRAQPRLNSPSGLAIELQQPWRNLLFARLLLIQECCRMVQHLTE